MKTADIVVIGGGVIGLSVAFHLARRQAGSVVVLEREAFVGSGSTAKCAGGIRQQFSTEANVKVSQESVRFLEHFEEETGVPLDFHQNGYLFLLGDPGHVEHFKRNIAMQNRLGVDSRLLTPLEAREIVPQLHVDDLLAAAFCSTDGLASPHEMTQGFARGARNRGAEILEARGATGIVRENGRIAAVTTADGGRIETHLVVNAAGPYAREVAAWAGVDLPVHPLRRHCFTTRPLEFLSVRFPMVVDYPSGVYMHQESGGMLLGLADKDEPYGFNEDVDWDFLPRVIEPAMHRIPELEQAEIANGWAGLYEDSPDHNAILGPVEESPGFFLANGFSGHGLMHAPAAGRIVADAVMTGRLPEEFASFSLNRFAGGHVAAEHDVI